MSDFFDSDIVREELQEINELQMSIYKNAMKFGTFCREDKVDHIERLTELLERQKVMYTLALVFLMTKKQLTLRITCKNLLN